MMGGRALITGVTGQDGFHLTKLLLSKKYLVFGLINGQRNSRVLEFQRLFPEVTLLSGDLTDFSSIHRAIERSQPDEIYNLGAISFVGLSFEQPELTANVTGLGALRIIEACRLLDPSRKIRIYQASSSEMFGKVREIPQTELTPFHPRSPYGVAKTMAHYSCVNYREAYGMHISCGILFNHEGEFRGEEFVTRKITKTFARIKLNKEKRIIMGDLSPKRDWGYAGDYVEAMWLMLQRQVPDDYVISTGETYSVEEFFKKVFEVSELPGHYSDYYEFSPEFKRPSEVDYLVGDSTKAFQILGWKPRVKIDQLAQLMFENDLRLERSRDL